MAAVAIYSTDVKLAERWRRQLREASQIAIGGVASDVAALEALAQQGRVDAVLADAPAQTLRDLRRHSGGLPIIALFTEGDAESALELLHGGASALVPRAAEAAEIVAAIDAALKGLAVLPHDALAALLDARSPETSEPPTVETQAAFALTPRELEVLTAMADGASNKVIARRLGISFHTAKFHVAAILAKLDADSRTEAVAKAAHLGLVML
jgi:DNA-binding NarL/FixJ family response regulator